jgi:TRAP-type C4-dicarboxylate transport system permease small subunit
MNVMQAMKGVPDKVEGLSRFLNGISGISLTFIMCITVTDIILRFFGRPIVGTYEIVSFCGALVIGFALPWTSWKRGHIYVDFLVLKLPEKARNSFNIGTRCLGVWLFLMMGTRLIRYGLNVYRSGELSPTLQIPFYPVAYGVALCCFAQCLVLLADIRKILRGQYE